MPTTMIETIQDLLKHHQTIDYATAQHLQTQLDQLKLESNTWSAEQKTEAKKVIQALQARIKNTQMQHPEADNFNTLEQALLKFESTHPKLTDIARQILQTLNNLGI